MILDSMARSAAAGIIGTSVQLAAATGEGALSFTPEYHRLLTASRNPMNEPAFQDASETGDPAVMRLWIAAEAALLADPAGEPTASDNP